MKALEQLSQHNQLLESAPVDSFKAVLDRRWKALGKEVHTYPKSLIQNLIFTGILNRRLL